MIESSVLLEKFKNESLPDSASVSDGKWTLKTLAMLISCRFKLIFSSSTHSTNAFKKMILVVAKSYTAEKHITFDKICDFHRQTSLIVNKKTNVLLQSVSLKI